MTRRSSKANSGKAPKEKRSKEPEVERFRSLEELNAAFNERRTIGFRSLGELSKDFQARQPLEEPTEDLGPRSRAPDQSSRTGGTGVLKKIFEGRGFGFITPDHDNGAGDVFLHFSDVIGAGARSLTIGTWVRYDVEPDAASGRLRAKNVSIIPDTPSTTASETPDSLSLPGQQGAEVETTLSSSTRSYNRDIMLGVFKALAASSRLQMASTLKLSTVHMPRPSYSGRGADQQEPSLDDERLIARLEARLDKETGADAMNRQTFGECAGGWSYEEAVAANEKLRFTAELIEQDSTTAGSAGGSFSEAPDVETSERTSDRGEDSDASDDRKETRRETLGREEEAQRKNAKWSWECASDKAKLLEDQRHSWEVQQQMPVSQVPLQVFQ